MHIDGVHWGLLVIELDQNPSQATYVVARSEMRALTLMHTLRTYTNPFCSVLDSMVEPSAISGKMDSLLGELV